MNSSDAIDIATDSLVVIAKLSAPFLLVVLAIGLIVGLMQSVTQLQEPTLSFVPKLIGAAIVIAVAGPWMLDELVGFSQVLFQRTPQLLEG
ncbi:MAG: flagellar biosynthetic protein FliQ [Ilumatobacter sp.]|jgi:flagellar biosynthesis protein FliQ|uniref:flagellar biosynthetic protein FliQ n=1 Tax=Ilumatobacter sp. TaxID=1967498 RepID=UPI00391D9EC4